jgi:hypothetical protein
MYINSWNIILSLDTDLDRLAPGSGFQRPSVSRLLHVHDHNATHAYDGEVLVVSLKRPPCSRFSMNQWLNESMSQCLNLVSPILVM